MLENKKKIIIGIISCVVVLLLIAIPVGINKLNDNKNEDKTVNKNSEDVNARKNSDKNESESDSSLDNSNVANGSNEGLDSSSSQDNNLEDPTTNGDKISSNYNTPDASLTIQRIKGYSGIFVEDGSDKEVKNIAAIQVKNTSKQVVEYAEIELYNGNKKLTFQVSTLPANSSMVVMEKDKKTLSSSKGVTYGKSTVAYTDKLEKTSDISYKLVDNNGIKVTNKSKKNLDCVRLFYKYKSGEGYYIGGITYTAKIEDLKAGNSQTIYPSHFDSDGGEIMIVKTYDE